MGLPVVRRIIEKRQRYKSHLVALGRYSTLRKLANLMRVEWERWRGKDVVKGLPYVVVLDPTNVCNLKCPVCPTTKGTLAQPSGRIGLDEYRRFVDAIAPHTYRLILYNWGEPLMHRQIVELISYAHKARISTMISSNLNILPREGAMALVESGLDDLVVSCDGLTQETYERYRVRGQLNNLTTNMRAIHDAKQRLRKATPRIEFQFLVFRHNEHELYRVEDFARHLGADTVRIVRPAVDMDSQDIQPANNPDWVRPEILEQLQVSREADAKPDKMRLETGHLENDLRPQGEREINRTFRLLDPIDCYWPWRVLVSSWNGDIDPCCYHNQLGSFGNIFEQQLTELINNDKFTWARRRITGRGTDESHDNIICKGCSGYTV